MTGKTHALIGGALGLGLALHFGSPPREAAVIVGAAIMGALLPDIDQPASIIGRRLWLVSHPVSWFTSHRGFTHTLLAWVLLYGFLAHVSPFIAAPLVVGFTSHLLADMATRTGLRLFWPARLKVYVLPRPLRLTTGGAAETFFAALVALALLWQVAQFTGLSNFDLRQFLGDAFDHGPNCEVCI